MLYVWLPGFSETEVRLRTKTLKKKSEGALVGDRNRFPFVVNLMLKN